MAFTRATKTQAKARVALIGPSGSGKTYTALRIARGLAGEGGRIALIDTEHGSASKYADAFGFDTFAPDSFNPKVYIDAIYEAEEGGYDVLVIDSLSHAWAGKDGVLEFVDNVAKRSGSGNSFAAWREGSPLHNSLVEALVGCQCHLIGTMRVKMEYVVETNDRGKQSPKKVGLQPVQRDGLEYEFDVVADLDFDHNLIVSKTRCPALDKAVIAMPGEDLGATLRSWLTDGAPAPTPTEKPIGQAGLESLKATAREVAAANGLSNEEVKAAFDGYKAHAGVAKLTDLLPSQRDELVAELRAMKAPEPEPEQPTADPDPEPTEPTTTDDDPFLASERQKQQQPPLLAGAAK